MTIGNQFGDQPVLPSGKVGNNITSLIGKSSGADKIKRAELYEKHNIKPKGAENDEDKKKAELPSTTFGGLASGSKQDQNG